MSTNVLEMSEVKAGRYYYLVFQEYDESIRYIEKLGVLISVTLSGRPYDPDVIMNFKNENGEIYIFDPPFSSSYGYIEYVGEEREEDIKKRIQKRTQILRDGIVGNDWALRPENVVATQGIDLSIYSREKP